MFSKRLFKIVGYRMVIMEKGYCSPFKWDSKNNRLRRSGQYCFWNFRMYTFYLTLYGVLLGIRLAQKTILKGNQIFGEDEVELVNPLEPFIRALDIAFIAIIIVISCFLLVIAEYKDEMMVFFNEMIDANEALEEMFKSQLRKLPIYKQTILFTEALVLVCCIATLIIPLMFGLLFLQETEPLHRFFVEVLEVKPCPDLESIPLILFVVWSILQCCNVANVFVVIGITYIKYIFFWLSCFQPVTISSGRSPKKYLTKFGYLDGSLMMRLYREQQLLNVMFSQFIANRRIATHQCAIQVVFVIASFVSIRQFELLLYTPGYQIAFLAVGLCVFVEFMETKTLAEAIDSSKNLREKVKKMTRRDDIVVKVIGKAWSLKFDAAYPYFHIGRHTFLEFMHSSVEILVDLLMAEDQ